jgi:hypothetical protein
MQASLEEPDFGDVKPGLRLFDEPDIFRVQAPRPAAV